MILKQSRGNDIIMIGKKNHQNTTMLLERKDSAEMSVNNDYYNDEKNINSRKKNVSFYPEVVMIETLHHKNYTPKEKIRCWYNKEDFVQIKKEAKRVLELIKAGGIPKDQHDKYCFRGLENRIYQRNFAKKRNRTEARRVVLEKQETHRQNPESEEKEQLIRYCSEEEIIATKYSLCSQHCAREACNMGFMDQLEAFKEDTLKDDYVEIKTRRKKLQQQQQQQWVSIFSGILRKHCVTFRNYLSRVV